MMKEINTICEEIFESFEAFCWLFKVFGAVSGGVTLLPDLSTAGVATGNGLARGPSGTRGPSGVLDLWNLISGVFDLATPRSGVADRATTVAESFDCSRLRLWLPEAARMFGFLISLFVTLARTAVLPSLRDTYAHPAILTLSFIYIYWFDWSVRHSQNDLQL